MPITARRAWRPTARRALYSGYNGPLYQVQRASDGATANIGLLGAGGYVNASEQDSFCGQFTCTITEIYDQSPNGNNLTVGPAGGKGGADRGAVANLLPVTVGAFNKAYGVDITPGVGYRDNGARGTAVNGQAEGMYMVASSGHVNSGCCFDFGNAETNGLDNGNGHMDAINLSAWCYFTPCTGTGPWVAADLENGLFQGGNGSNTANRGNVGFVTAMLKNNGQTTYALKGGSADLGGGLTTWYNGPLPNIGGYAPMHQEGGITLGVGGDNSNSGVGLFFEGVMTSGYPSDAADAAVQANIVSAQYSNSFISPSGGCSIGGPTPGSGGATLLSVLDSSGQVWAKEGGLGAGWVLEVGNRGPAPSGAMKAVAVASDPLNGPLIAVLDSSGQVWAKEGGLGAGWVLQVGNSGRRRRAP